MARVLEAAGANVTAFDIAPDYGYGGGVDSLSDDLRKGHEDEDVGFGLVHADGKLRYFRAQLIGDLAPLQFCAVEIVLGEDGCDDFLRVCRRC